MNTSNDHLSVYIQEQDAAERMLPLVGSLYRQRGVIVTVFGRKLLSSSTIDIIKAHRLAHQTAQEGISVDETMKVLEAIVTVNPGSCRIDLGLLALAARKVGSLNDVDFVLEHIEKAHKPSLKVK